MPGSKHGWKCSKCTFEHQFPGTRCVMCQSLRTTKEQLRDFVIGIPIPESSKINTSIIGTSSSSGTSTGPTKTMTTAAASTTTTNSTGNTAAASALPARPISTDTERQQARTFFQASSTATTRPPKTAPQTSSRATVETSSNTNNNHDRSTSKQNDNNHNPTLSTTTSNQTNRAGRNTSAKLADNNANIANNLIHQSNPNHNAGNNSGSRPLQAQARAQPVITKKSAPKPTATATATSKKRRRNSTAPPQPDPTLRKRSSLNRVTLPYVPGPVPLDESTLSTWIFPLHDQYPKRQYQQDMVQAALLENTLVSLPTGLGKTMIAAVIMYNYYRWFSPTGKIVFCAPTLPLVHQQVRAIYDIVGLPVRDTAVLTGKINAVDRQVLWRDKRIFFCTPQTVQNDLLRSSSNTSREDNHDNNNDNTKNAFSQIVCLVLDEVHKATGDHAYVQVVQLLRETTAAHFRLVGLSATPGPTIQACQEIIRVLGISRIESRFEDDPDISKHTHDRCDEIARVRETSLVTILKSQFSEVMRPYLRFLQDHQFLVTVGSGATMGSYTVVKAMEEYRGLVQAGQNVHPGLHLYFKAVHLVVQWRDSVVHYGLGDCRTKLASFLGMRKGGVLAELADSAAFRAVQELVFPAEQGNQTAPNILAENPKLHKLQEVLTEHFQRDRALAEQHRNQQELTRGDASSAQQQHHHQTTSTRAIVFSQFRDSVAEIVQLLESSRPLIRPSRFVGQGKGVKVGDDHEKTIRGMNQAEQQAVIQAFRDGTFNVLVCTSIGEEGLDVGQCDLIVMYDTLQSPTRMIQRVGRTGRARNGRVVLLLTKEEEFKYRQAKSKEKTLLRSLRDPEKFKFHPNRLMFPPDRPLPVLCEQKGLTKNTTEFRLSQVVGNYDPTKRKRHKNGKGSRHRKRQNNIRCLTWRLTEEEDRRRTERVGITIPCSFTSSEFPSILQQRLLKGREMSFSAQTPVDLSRYRLGRTLVLLRRIEENHGDRYDPSKVVVPKSMLRGDAAVQKLFPLKEDTTPTRVLARNISVPPTTHMHNEATSKRSRGATVSTSHNTATQQLPVDPQSSNSKSRSLEKPSLPAPSVHTSTERNTLPPTHDEQQMGKRVAITLPTALELTTVAPSSNPYGKSAAMHTRSHPPVAEKSYQNTPSNSSVQKSEILPGQNRSVQATESRTGTVSRVGPTMALPFGENVPHQSIPALGHPKYPTSTAKDTAQSWSGSIAWSATESVLAPETLVRRDDGRATCDTRVQQQGASFDIGTTREKDGEHIATHPTDVEFCLPTPPDSSSSSEEDDNDPDDESFGSDDQIPKPESKASKETNTSVGGLLESGDKVNNMPPEHSPKNEHSVVDKPTAPQGEFRERPARNNAPAKSRVVVENMPIDLGDKARSVVDNRGGGGLDLATKSSFQLPTQSDSSSSSSSSSSSTLLEEQQEDQTEGESTDPINRNEKGALSSKGSKNINGTANKKISKDLAGELPSFADDDEDEDGVYEADSDDDLPLVALRVNAFYSSPQETRVPPANGTSHEESPENTVFHKRKVAKKTNHFLTQGEDSVSSTTTPKQKTPDSNALVDTPIDSVPSNSAQGHTSAQVLADTPPVEANLTSAIDDDLDDIACAVCLSKDFHEDDPIVLCDGFAGRSCSLAVHTSCYSLKLDSIDLNDGQEWRCDPCHLQNQIHVAKEIDDHQVMRYARCLLCQKSGGPLKRVSKKIWHHPYCVHWQNHTPVDDMICCICSEKGAVRCGKEGCKLAAHPHCAISAIASGVPGASWTFLRANFSSASSVNRGRHQSVMFCPRDIEEAKTIFDSLSAVEGIKNVLTIPPKPRFRATKRRLKKIAEQKPPLAPRRQSKEGITLHGEDDQIPSLDTDEARQARKRARLESRKRARRFIDEEAGIGSDDDLEGDAAEERDLAALEAEEDSVNSFINDSSQLGYTQDELGRVDPDVSSTPAPFNTDTGSSQGGALHRRVDNERIRQNQYTTPLLNRKIRRNSLTPTDAPSSEKGLGKMHFVRSVLEHHKNGGDADEIERAYHQLEQEVEEDDSDEDGNTAMFDYGFGD